MDNGTMDNICDIVIGYGVVVGIIVIFLREILRSHWQNQKARKDKESEDIN